MFNTQIAVDEFARLQKLYGFRTCFETGTHTGVGSLGASEFCPLVVTSELNPDRRDDAVKRFLDSGYEEFKAEIYPFKMRAFRKAERAIWSMLGNSPGGILTVLTTIQFCAPLCFYLDAHWNDYWPLRDELEVIADLKLSDSVIIIHDCKVPQEWEPGNGYGFDSYKGQDLCFEYVADLLAKINPNYKIAYNKGGGPRGILYALP